MAREDFEELARTYRLELEERRYDERDILNVGFEDYEIGCTRDRDVLGDHQVVYLDGIDRLDPEMGEFADEYARSVLGRMNGFTDVGTYLARRGVVLKGVNDDLYSQVRGRVDRLFRP